MFCINFSGAEYDTKLGGSQGSTVKTLLEELYEKVKNTLLFCGRSICELVFRCIYFRVSIYCRVNIYFTVNIYFRVSIYTLELIFTLESTQACYLLLVTRCFLRVFMVFRYI